MTTKKTNDENTQDDTSTADEIVVVQDDAGTVEDVVMVLDDTGTAKEAVLVGSGLTGVRRNDEVFINYEPHPDFSEHPWLPLRAVRGPKSDRLAGTLEQHSVLSRFADGVDERATLSGDHFVCASSSVDWDIENNHTPLVFARYAKELDAYEVACFEVEEVELGFNVFEYQVRVSALVDIYRTGGDPSFIEWFIDDVDPILLKVHPEVFSAEADIFRLYLDNFEAVGEVVSRLAFITNVLCDPGIQFDPT